MIHGLILIDKPPGISSHDVVARIRRCYRIRKVGHFGTLDPLARGLLLVGLGNVTKFFQFYVKKRKIYSGTVKFGISTSTYDREGETVGQARPVSLTEEDIRRLEERFTGEIMQKAPLYSAKKKKGKPLYKYARQNIPVEVKASRVNIYSLDLEITAPDTLRFRTETSEGTYIRSLAHDMGAYLGSGAYLDSLLREQVGEYRLTNAVSLKDLDAGKSDEELRSRVIPIEKLFPEWPGIILSGEAEFLARNGGAVTADHIDGILPDGDTKIDCFRLFTRSGALIAIARKEKEKKAFKPFIVFPDH